MACMLAITSLRGSTVLRPIYALIFYDDASVSPIGQTNTPMASPKRMMPSGHLLVEAFLRLPNESISSILSHICRKDMPSRCSSMLPGESRIRKLRSSPVLRRVLRRYVLRVRESCLQKSIGAWAVTFFHRPMARLQQEAWYAIIHAAAWRLECGNAH